MSVETKMPSSERPIITQQPDCKMRPSPALPIHSASEAIQKIGSFSASSQTFLPRSAFPDSGIFYRRHTPTKELTAELHQLYETGRASRSGEKVQRWWVSAQTPLGTGAFSHVYPMTDAKTGRSVAGKLNHPIPVAYQCGQEEYQTLHEWQGIPHIVHLLGGVDFPGAMQKLIVMERVDLPLNQLLHTQGKFPFADVLLIFRQLLEMHVAASERSLVHADLKPENLSYKDGKLSIYDLGFAHSLKKHIYGANAAQTLWYRAPEMILGKPYDASIDLWSIGCIVYELFCGKLFVYSPDDTAAGQIAIMHGIGRKIGPPSAAYLHQTPFNRAFFGEPSPRNLQNYIRAEALSRRLPPEETELFLSLLEQILRFEGRIDARSALAQCNRLIHPEGSSAGLESKS